MKVIFMGTPYFAVPALQGLIDSKHEIIAVYTKPPKPAGRGGQTLKSQVHLLAEGYNLPIMTPTTLKSEEAYQQFASFKADVAVVAAYGLLLPERILAAPKFGCINIHPSKLPRWRGAAPIQHTILAGDRETAVCIIQMDAGMDTGDILLTRNLQVDDKTTALMLYEQTADIGAQMVLETLSNIEDSSVVARRQSDDGITHARKIERSDEVLDFSRSAYLVNAQVRVFSPRPGAYFTYNGENIKILEATYDDAIEHGKQPSTVLDDKLTIACGKGVLKPLLLQREGRKAIYLDAFLRGFAIPIEAVLVGVDIYREE